MAPSQGQRAVGGQLSTGSGDDSPSASAGQTVKGITFYDRLFCSMVCGYVLVSVTCPMFPGSCLDVQARQVGSFLCPRKGLT